MNRGSDGNPLGAADVEKKFTDNARRPSSASRAQCVMDLVMAPDSAPDVVALTEAPNG